MTITTKLKIAAWAPLFTALAVGVALGFSYVTIRTARDQQHSIESINRHLNEMHSLVAGYLLYHHERGRQQFLGEYEIVGNLLSSLRLTGAEQQRVLGNLRENTAAIKEMFVRTVATYAELRSGSEATVRPLDADLLTGQLLVRSRKAVADGLGLEKLVETQIAATQRKVNILLAAALILVVMIPLTLILMRVMGRINRSLVRLHQGTAALGAGNLAHRIGMVGKDELAELARAFDRMAGSLESLTVRKNLLEQEVAERRRVEQALTDSDQRIQQALSLSRSFTFRWEPATDAVERSIHCAPILRLAGDEAIHDSGQRFFQRVHPEDRERFGRTLDGLSPEADHYRIEYRLVAGDGGIVDLEETGQAIFDPAGKLQGLFGVTTDITARKRAEQKLAEAHAASVNETNRLSALMEALPVGVAIVDSNGGAIGTNSAYERLWAGPRPPVKSVDDYAAYKAWWADTGQPVRPEQWASAQAVKNGVPVLGQLLQIERFDGSRAFVLNHAAPIHDTEGRVVGAAVAIEDISDLRQRTAELQQLTATLEQRVRDRTAALDKTNEELRHLSTRLLSAQEAERKRVAAEMHDTIGASLSAIKFMVEAAALQIRQAMPGAEECLTPILPCVVDTIQECRRIQVDLRPSILDDLGLLPALTWFCRRFKNFYPAIAVEQELGVEEGQVPEVLKIVIYRVTQEAMNNVAKHSRATVVRLSLGTAGEQLVLVIGDNGCGFDPVQAQDAACETRGMGLSGMRERTQLFGGTFCIESMAGCGTTVRATWPAQGVGPRAC